MFTHLSKNRLRTVFLEETSLLSSLSGFITVFKAHRITEFTCFLNLALSMNISVSIFLISSSLSSALIGLLPFDAIPEPENSLV